MLNSYNLTLNELINKFSEWGYSKFYAVQFWKYLYQGHVTKIENMTSLRSDLRDVLSEKITIIPLTEKYKIHSSDNLTIKYLLGMEDKKEIETVYMQYNNRVTGCISTQVGCGMGCVFCATGQMGFSRNLSAGEIVGQAMHIDSQAISMGKKFRNIVLMGMGEPLHNYKEVKKAIQIVTNQQGLGIAGKHITLSTVGLVPQIYQMADDKLPVRLAVSLHGSTDEERQSLIPIATKWSLADLMAACKYYTDKMGWHIMFEWTLIEGKNDSLEIATRLCELLKNIPSHINLIQLNPIDGYAENPANNDAAKAFQNKLKEFGIPSTLRQRRGIDINAGCGQLKNKLRI